MKLFNQAWFLNTVYPALWVNWPIVISTFLYMTEAVICWRAHKVGGMIMFVGYTIGNVGIFVALL
jgi:hypothetical protein